MNRIKALNITGLSIIFCAGASAGLAVATAALHVHTGTTPEWLLDGLATVSAISVAGSVCWASLYLLGALDSAPGAEGETNA